MLFWKKVKHGLILYFFLLLIEFGVILFLSSWQFLLIFLCLTPLHLFLTIHMVKSYRFNSHIFSSCIFYSKALICWFAILHMLPDIALKIGSNNCLTACFCGFFVSIVGKTLLNIGLSNKSKTVLFTNENNLHSFFSFYPSLCGEIFYEDNSIDIIKQKIENKTISKIMADTCESAIKLINSFNGNYPHIKIHCIEAENNSLFNTFLNNNCIHSKDEQTENNFFGARILIIGNNENLILSFIEKSYQLECSSVILLTDCLKICEKFASVCKSVFFSRDDKFKEIDNKYSFDIIFDAYIIKSYNFQNYRAIMKDLSEVIKNKKAIVSITKQGMLVDEWLLNLSKEIILRKFYEGNFGLSVVSFRCGEFSYENLFSLSENLVVFPDFIFQSTKNISYSAWKTLWTIEKGTFNIISNSVYAPKIDSTLAIRIKEQEIGYNVSFDIFAGVCHQETIEALNKDFIKHRVNFSLSSKVVGESLLDKTIVTSEDIAKAML